MTHLSIDSSNNGKLFHHIHCSYEKESLRERNVPQNNGKILLAILWLGWIFHTKYLCKTTHKVKFERKTMNRKNKTFEFSLKFRGKRNSATKMEFDEWCTNMHRCAARNHNRIDKTGTKSLTNHEMNQPSRMPFRNSVMVKIYERQQWSISFINCFACLFLSTKCILFVLGRDTYLAVVEWKTISKGIQLW